MNELLNLDKLCERIIEILEQTNSNFSISYNNTDINSSSVLSDKICYIFRIRGKNINLVYSKCKEQETLCSHKMIISLVDFNGGEIKGLDIPCHELFLKYAQNRNL